MSPTRWGTDLPGVTAMVGAGSSPGPVVALTFDACGGRGGDGYDAALVDLLRAEQARATLFLNSRWIRANPRVFEDLAADPLFDIADHGTRHVPLSVTGRAAYGIAGTRDPGEVYDEVMGNALDLERRLHPRTTLVRSGTAHYDDVAVRIVRDLGLVPVGFDVNGDAGATFSPRQVQAAMRTVRPGSVVIGHLNHPGRGTAAGMALALPRLRRDGYSFVHVADHLA
ncbi:polysaccharide deacetylase family protein [Terrabacter aerolatus]